MPTLKEVASLAEVSIATASRVLRNDPSFSVNHRTAERVRQAAERLHYRPKRADLPRSHLHVGALRLFGPHSDDAQNPYFQEICAGIVEECAHQGIMVSSFDGFGSGLAETDGLIILGDLQGWTERLRGVKPIVVVDHSPCPSRWDSVVINYTQAVTVMMDHLSSRYPRIGFLGGAGYLTADGVRQEDPRARAFKEYMRTAERFRPEDVYIGGWSPDAGYNLMEQALRQPDPPPAFFVASDRLALGAMKAARDAGLSLPDDLALAGFDDNEAARYANPTLTTIRTWPKHMGMTAVRLLIDRWRGWDMPRQVTFPGQLIIRQSCGVAPQTSTSG